MMKKVALLGLIGALSLPLFARPASAASVTPIAIAQGSDKPWAFCFADTADGKVGTDKNMAASVAKSYAGMTYVLAKENVLIIGTPDGNGGIKPFRTPVLVPADDKGTVFILHYRAKNSSEFVDGVIYRNNDKGVAELYITLQDGKGNSRSVQLEQGLAFQSSNGGGGGENGGGDGGSNPFGF
jgi:hypothetical protein